LQNANFARSVVRDAGSRQVAANYGLAACAPQKQTAPYSMLDVQR